MQEHFADDNLLDDKQDQPNKSKWLYADPQKITEPEAIAILGFLLLLVTLAWRMAGIIAAAFCALGYYVGKRKWAKGRKS